MKITEERAEAIRLMLIDCGIEPGYVGYLADKDALEIVGSISIGTRNVLVQMFLKDFSKMRGFAHTLTNLKISVIKTVEELKSKENDEEFFTGGGKRNIDGLKDHSAHYNIRKMTEENLHEIPE